MGASFEVCADPRLVPALTALGYDRQSGNRFTRTQGTRVLVIDARPVLPWTSDTQPDPR